MSGKPPSITVLIADSQRLFSGALAAALREKPSLAVLEDRPTTGPECVKAVSRWHPDVVFIDHWIESANATKEIVRRSPGTRVIVLSWIHGPGQIQEAIDAGATGFLPKSVGLEDVTNAIRLAHAGEALLYPEQLEQMMNTIEKRQAEAEEFADRLAQLSAREFQILILLSRGNLIQEVATELNIKASTVTTHINRILKKTGARSHAEVLAMARLAGAIQT